MDVDTRDQADAIWQHLRREDYLELTVGNLTVGWQERPRTLRFGRHLVRIEKKALAFLGPDGRAIAATGSAPQLKRLTRAITRTYERLLGKGRPTWARAKTRTDRAALQTALDLLTGHLPKPAASGA